MPRALPRDRERGFTLLEVLVALVVLGLLVVGLARGVRTGLSFWDAQARRVADTGELDAVARSLRQMLTDIAVKPRTGENAAAPGAITLAGQRDRLTFAGALPTGLGASETADMTLALQQRRLMLTWRPHRHEKDSAVAPASRQTVLVAGVERLDFAYWGEAAPGEQPGWLATWTRAELPGLIRVRLAFGKGDPRRWPDLIAAPRLWAASH